MQFINTTIHIIAQSKWNLLTQNLSSYIDFNKKNYKEDPKFKVDDNIRILKYKKYFAEGCIPNWFEEVFVIKKVKNAVLWTYAISNLISE